jgi:hypothetical protein
MALIGKAGASRDLCQACLTLAEKRGRPLEPEMDDVLVRGHPDGSLEHARETFIASCSGTGDPGRIRPRL